MNHFKYCLIINVRNGEKYLEQCLKSLTEQTFKIFDIFIFDNQSSDNTSDIIECFVQKFGKQIKYIFLDTYLEINQARNFALSYIKKNYHDVYTYFSFCDADDMWHPEWLMNINENAREDSIIYTHGFELSGDQLKDIFVNHHVPRYSIFSSRVQLQGTVVPFSFVENDNFFDEAFVYCIDVDKWNELYSNGVSFICVNKQLFYYRIHDSSMSSYGFTTVMLERWAMTNKYGRSRLFFAAKFIFYLIKHLVLKLK